MGKAKLPAEHVGDTKAVGAGARSPRLERQLVFWLCALSAIALYWPDSRASQDSRPAASREASRESPAREDPSFIIKTLRFLEQADPFLNTAFVIPYLVAAAMFFMGWMLPREQVQEVARSSRFVVQGVGLQYLSMPLLAWGLASVWGFEGAQRTGMILVGAVPGAMASNVLTLNARGNASYSVSLTTVATMLSPFLVPLALRWTLGKEAPYEPYRVMSSLLVQVVAPVLLGHGLRRLRPAWTPWAESLGPLAANLTILWIIAIVVAKNRERLLAVETLAMVVPLLALNLTGYAVGYLGGAAMGAPEPMRRALTLEIGMQNAGVGTMLAIQQFPERPAAALPPAVYTFGCMLTGAVLARWWAGQGPAGRPHQS